MKSYDSRAMNFGILESDDLAPIEQRALLLPLADGVLHNQPC